MHYFKALFRHYSSIFSELNDTYHLIWSKFYWKFQRDFFSLSFFLQLNTNQFSTRLMAPFNLEKNVYAETLRFIAKHNNRQISKYERAHAGHVVVCIVSSV